MRKPRKRFVVWMTYHGAAKLIAAIIMVSLTVMAFTKELPDTKTWSHWTLPLSGAVIVVDAGHGGPDGGAVSRSGISEKQINLNIALHLQDYLQEAGAVVMMTRETDTDLADAGTKGYSKRKTQDLLRRAAFIKQQRADLFVSIHLNSFPSRRLTGAQTFYFPSNPENARLAALIQEEIKSSLNNTTRLPKTVKTLYLLKTSPSPSALVEAGFLSNENEARLLAKESYQKKVAAAIYRGILRYCSGEKFGSP